MTDFFKIESPIVAQAGLEITVYPRLASNFEQFSCLNLLYMEIHLSVTMPSTIEFQCITLPFYMFLLLGLYSLYQHHYAILGIPGPHAC